jgi:hypothetical protein
MNDQVEMNIIFAVISACWNQRCVNQQQQTTTKIIYV